MAIILEANYAKKLGLPGYSSHQYSVSIRAELTDLSQIEEESSRLYQLLQNAVDQSIQQVGFLPDATTIGTPSTGGTVTRNSQHKPTLRPSTQTSSDNSRHSRSDWRCSDRQCALIHKIVEEHNLNKNDVEHLAQQMFGAGVKQLNRLQASGLIDELFAQHGGGSPCGNGKPRQNGHASHPANIATVAAQVRSVSRPANGGNLL